MNNGEIIIRVISEQGQGGTTKPAQVNTQVTEEQVSESSGSSGSNIGVTALAVTALQNIGNSVKNVTIGYATYAINRNFKLTDNYLGQQNLNIAKSIAGKFEKIGMATASGAMMGGGVGAIAALVVSTITTAIETGFDVWNIQLRQMDAQLQYSRQRAGYSLTAGSIGENR